MRFHSGCWMFWRPWGWKCYWSSISSQIKEYNQSIFLMQSSKHMAAISSLGQRTLGSKSHTNIWAQEKILCPNNLWHHRIAKILPDSKSPRKERGVDIKNLFWLYSHSGPDVPEYLKDFLEGLSFISLCSSKHSHWILFLSIYFQQAIILVL